MSGLLIDTSVLIDYSRGREFARRFLDDRHGASTLATSLVCEAEFLRGARSRREMSILQAFLKRFDILTPSPTDLEKSMELFVELWPMAGVEWNDCIIAATAMRHGLSVATSNERHFSRIRGLVIVSASA